MNILKGHIKPSGKVLICENLLPAYMNDTERPQAVEKYYSRLLDFYAQGNATSESQKAIEEVYHLEVAGEEEHKEKFAKIASRTEK